MTLEQQKLANEMIKTFVSLPKHPLNNSDGSVDFTVKLRDVLDAWAIFARAVENTAPFEIKSLTPSPLDAEELLPYETNS